MKVILRQNYEPLGQVGDVVDVKDGYAHNFLLPRKIAYIALDGNLRALEDEKKAVLKKDKHELDFLVANEQECFQQIRRLLSFLPPNCRELPRDRPNDDPADRPVPELEELVPSNPQRAYDIRKVIRSIVDEGDFMEAKPDFAKNIVTGFARMGGQASA